LLETFVAHLLEYMHVIQNIGALLTVDFVLSPCQEFESGLAELLHFEILIDDGQKIKERHICHLVLLEQIVLIGSIFFFGAVGCKMR